MVKKNQNDDSNKKKGKLRDLKVTKETVKDLTKSDAANVKGGKMIIPPGDWLIISCVTSRQRLGPTTLSFSARTSAMPCATALGMLASTAITSPIRRESEHASRAARWTSAPTLIA